jgi:phosphoglycerate dehydrogenase-like enzyme
VRDTLKHLSDDVDFVLWDMSGPAPAPDIDIVVPPYLRPVSVLERLKGVRVRLVQSQLVGYDGVENVLPEGVVYANAASVHETSTAELTLALILAAQRGIPDFVRAAGTGRWAPAWHPSLADRRVLLIGYGGVGKAIESRLLPFEIELTRATSASTSAASSTTSNPCHGCCPTQRS